MEGTKMLFKKRALIITAILVCLAVILFIKINNDHSTEINAPLKGYGIVLDEPSGIEHKSFTINLEKEKLFNYNLKFINNSGSDNSFVLLMFLDYKQIPFYFEGKENMVKQFVFKTRDGEETTLPVRFPLDDLNLGSHDLVISILSGPNKHARTFNSSTDFYGVTTRYNIQISKETDFFNLPKIDIPINSFKNNTFSGVLLNQKTKKIDNFYFPPVKVNAKAGEKVNFALRAGGYSDTQEYLSWVMIGWNQISLENNQDFWYFQVPKSFLGYKQITLIAPEKKGDYEVCAYLVANPWKKISETQNIGIDTSYRFTLHVE
jgi:hypothetical protein